MVETLPLDSVDGTSVSMPARTNTGWFSAPMPRATPIDGPDTWPIKTALPKKRRFWTPGTGPPSDPSNRLSPVALLDALSVSHEPEPDSVLPPARVVYEITPDWASENSTPSAPVVTDASSIAFVPSVMRAAPLLVPRIGAPST